jgi:poly-D-alanine transfer protein DltD
MWWKQGNNNPFTKEHFWFSKKKKKKKTLLTSMNLRVFYKRSPNIQNLTLIFKKRKKKISL